MVRLAKGRILLKIGGILEIVVGAFYALVAFLVLALGTTIFNYLGYDYYFYNYSGMGYTIIAIVAIVLLIVAAVYLFLGIFALKNNNNPARGTAIMVLGIIFGALSLLSLSSGELGFLSLLELGAMTLFVIGGAFNRQTKNQIDAEIAMQSAGYGSPYTPNYVAQPQAPQQQPNPYSYGQQPAQPNYYGNSQPQAPVQPQAPTQPSYYANPQPQAPVEPQMPTAAPENNNDSNYNPEI